MFPSRQKVLKNVLEVFNHKVSKNIKNKNIKHIIYVCSKKLYLHLQMLGLVDLLMLRGASQ